MSSLAGELKKRIFKEEKVEELFELMGCDWIDSEQGGTLITAQLPSSFESQNKRAVQCRVSEHLNCYIRNVANFEGDILNLFSYLKNKRDVKKLNKFVYEACVAICKAFRWEGMLKGHREDDRPDYLSPLRSLKGRKRLSKPNKVISEDILNYYKAYPIKSWIKEGIPYDIQQSFGVGFDLDSKRITIPIRNRLGELIGVKGRMLLESDVSDSNPKYKYLHRCNISQELFGYYIAKSYAQEEKELIIVESEKSVMKFHANGIYNVVALGSSDITSEHKRMIFNIGYGVNIVLAYDNDKPMDEIQGQADILEGRRVQCVYDTDGIMPEKYSPIDAGLDTWNKLYEEYKYDLM